ncbi:MAG: hypothetical protein Q9187_000121 [Circinaria calcarea]
MLIGICGGVCAGKHTVANYLVEHHAFSQLHLVPTTAPLLVGKPALELHIPDYDHQSGRSGRSDSIFHTVEALTEFVTQEWHRRWVITDIWDEKLLETLSRRPFFLLVSVDSPMSLRWRRFKARYELRRQAPPSLEEFIARDDYHRYDSASALVKLMELAQVHLINAALSLSELHDALSKLDLTDEQRLRPSWDLYFMQLASLAAQRSNCMKRRVGCVLVREKRVISTGYNGTPRNLRNCNEGGCPRCNNGQGVGVGLSTCLCIHAEENALLEAGRERIREGSILYCDT